MFGIMAIHDSRLHGTDAYIQILNSDGSMAQACGNGTRCVVQALSADTGKQAFTFQTVAGIVNARELEDGLIAVDMGAPEFRWDRIPLAEGTRRRPDPRLRNSGLCSSRIGCANGKNRASGHRESSRRSVADRLAGKQQPRHDDWACRMGIFRQP